jgi:hypothetical protein
MQPLVTTIEPLANVPVAITTTQRFRIETLKNVHGLYLYCTVAGVAATEAEMIADIGQIRVVIGGHEIVNLTATEIFLIHHYFHDKNGVAAWVPAGQLPILFMPADFPWSGQSRYFRFGMKASADAKDLSINDVRVEVTYLTPGGGLTVDTVVPYLITDDDTPETIGDHMRWLRYNTTWAGTTLQDITDLPRDKAAQAVLDTTVGVIASFSVIKNDRFVYRNVPAEIMDAEEFRAGRNLQADITRLPFDQARDPSSMLVVSDAANLTVAPTWSTAPGAYSIIRQEIHRGLVG